MRKVLFFTLLDAISALSGVIRRSLVLRHSAAYFPTNSRDIACLVAELNATLCLEMRAKK